MVQAIRRHVNATTVIAVFALVFAMTGGAYAAKKFLITSKGQISPKVLKSLKGATGAKGANGAAGPQGPAGAPGPAGAKGENGKDGAEGKEGKAGPEGKPGAKGEQGTPGTTGFTETLPSGKTETGTWSASQETEEVGTVSPISFTIPLAEGLAPAQVHIQGAPNFEEFCPGSAESPKAAKGNLCIYLGISLGKHGLEPEEVKQPFSLEEGAGTNGAIIRMAQPNTAEPTTAWGSWAVTAP